MDRRRLPLWQAWLVFGVLTALYAAVSFQQYNRMDSFILDLGFYESLIRDYAHGHFPRMPLTDSTPAALHFNPALALVAPVILVWNSPYAVLLTQAVLVAVGVVPLMRAAGRGWLPWVVAVSYGLAPGFASLIGFDFHDVALAVPLLAFSMAAMVRGDHRAAVLWALPLLLVKEDLGLTLAALGLVVFLRGSRRLGLATMVVGAVSFLVMLLWVLPAIQGAGNQADLYAPHGPGDALRTLFTGADVKSRTVLYLLIPTGLMALRSPMLLLVALPTFGWRFVSRPLHLLGAVVPLRRRPGADRRGRDDRGGTAAARPDPGRGPGGRRRRHPRAGAHVPFSQVWQTGFWDTPPRTAAVDKLLDRIPDGSRVAASDTLGSRIALRTDLYLVGDTFGPDGPPLPSSEFAGAEWIAIDTQAYVAPVPAWKGVAALLDTGEFRVVAEDEGVVVARRVAPAPGE